MSKQEERLKDNAGVPTPFEIDLAALAPRVDDFDRDRLFYLAGHAAATRDMPVARSFASGWSWPTAFSAMTALAASLFVMLLIRPGTREVTGIAPHHNGAASVAVLDSSPAAKEPFGGATVGRDDEVASSAQLLEENTTDGESGPETYSELRLRMLTHGDVLDRPREQRSHERGDGRSVSVKPIIVADAPLSYHELLKRLTEKPALPGVSSEQLWRMN